MNRLVTIFAGFSLALTATASSHNLLRAFRPDNTKGPVISVKGTAVLPDGTEKAQAQLCIKDREGNWYQQLLPEYLHAGGNTWSFDISPESADKWQAIGHGRIWNHRSLLTPQLIELKIFPGESEISNIEFVQDESTPSPPKITDIRQNRKVVPCRELFEVKFRLPDRYDNPFDPAQIDVSAIFSIGTNVAPVAVINGFYIEDYYITTNSFADERTPYGLPEWAVRFAPPTQGDYTCRIVAKDASGTTTSLPISFRAIESGAQDFVRVSKKDCRRFEEGGREFHPIGHNIRSPFDTRMDDQYPWVLRHPEGFMAYERYFRAMKKAGENIAEIWMCQWSLGLEWTTNAPSYHGLGDYNLGNAWELDQVLRMARENGLRINLVLNNHGRAGLSYDAEWQRSPFNVNNGGFLPANNPMAFFSDARALEYQKQIYRYIIARWGWDSTIFAWELWSELDLCGTPGMEIPPQKTPSVIEWHRTIGNYFHSLDYNRHLISTHISSDHNALGQDLSMLPQIDHCCVDAYHFSRDPLHIVDLVRDTAAHVGTFNKPGLITEFGGCSMGAGLSHLKCELHAALWASTCSTLGATPFFWWWGLIEEQNLYAEYTAVKNFTDGISYANKDYRNVPLQLNLIGTRWNQELLGLRSLAITSGTNLCAWIYSNNLVHKAYGESILENIEAQITWQPTFSGTYRFSFISTETGLPIKQQDFRTENGIIRVGLPPFEADIAVKVEPLILSGKNGER